MNLKLILFDFDGTIADTFEETVEIFNLFAKKYNYRRVEPEELEHCKGMNVWELMNFLRIPKHRIPFLLKRGRSILHDKLESIEIFEGIPEFINKAKSLDVSSGIVTSNSRKNVEHFLKLKSLDGISFVRSSNKLLGKPREFRKILNKYKLKPDNIIYVGDECRDIDAAKESGIPVIAVTWGYNSRESLEKMNPDYLIDDSKMLLETLDRLVEPSQQTS